MDSTQLALALDRIKAKEAEETRSLEARIAKARRLIAACEENLQKLRAKYDYEAQELWQEFSGRKPPASAQPVGAAVAPPSRGRGRRLKRGSLDEPVLAMLTAWGVPNFAVASVTDEWNRRIPEMPVNRATMRGVLDRLQTRGKLGIASEGGPGSANPRLWRMENSASNDVPFTGGTG